MEKEGWIKLIQPPYFKDISSEAAEKRRSLRVRQSEKGIASPDSIGAAMTGKIRPPAPHYPPWIPYQVRNDYNNTIMPSLNVIPAKAGIQ
ncbi:hypothetical protein ACFLXA_01825 [Chloroflexota bacterium]